MLLLGLLLYMWRAVREAPRVDGGAGLRALGIAASAAVLCAVIAGGYMAGTQNYGRADYRLGDGAHHACGKEFPTCNGDFMPFGRAELVDIHLTHRALVYLATALVLALVIVALRRRVAVRYAGGLAALLVLQIVVGALNVWLDEYELLILLHLALGTLLWASSLGMTLQLAPASERAAGRAEAVTA
jgi:heme A synthase